MPSLSWRWRTLLVVALAGAVGGGINAWLCFVRIPVPVEDDPSFRWVIVPGGALHGAALAAIPLAVAMAVSRRPLWFRLLLLPVVGWTAGYVSWIPLHHWGLDETWGDSLRWAFDNEASFGSVGSTPFRQFGLVAVIYFLALTLRGGRRSLAGYLTFGICAGVLGSLWWWIELGPWYFAPIHGTIWGTLVGIGMHVAGRPQLD
jgi:hypothetical protein